ncbi:hypothetical protein CC79DRAFT_1331056 [Sarocladium strictum]
MIARLGPYIPRCSTSQALLPLHPSPICRRPAQFIDRSRKQMNMNQRKRTNQEIHLCFTTLSLGFSVLLSFVPSLTLSDWGTILYVESVQRKG